MGGVKSMHVLGDFGGQHELCASGRVPSQRARAGGCSDRVAIEKRVDYAAALPFVICHSFSGVSGMSTCVMP